MVDPGIQIIQFLAALFVAGTCLLIGRAFSGYSKKTFQKPRKEGGFRHISSFDLPGTVPQVNPIVHEQIPQDLFFPAIVELPLQGNKPMIETHNLRKIFVSKKKGKRAVVEAVRGITFTVAQGEIFGLLGPNGAGKTTTMRMLSTLITPSSGSAHIDGEDLLRDQKNIRSAIGYVSQVGGMQRESTGRENLLLQAKLYGMSTREAEARVQELLKLFEIESFADRRTATYSGGQRRIFDLASGIVHRPKLLFLDEPSTGLDPQNRVHVWEQVQKLHNEGTTIFVTTHYLEEADALCDRVAIVDQGTIVAIGSPAQLKRDIAEDVITLVFSDTVTALAARDTLADHSFYIDATVVGSSVHLAVQQGNENLPAVMQVLHERAMTIESISLARPTLDDVFLKLTGRSMRENG